MFDPIAEKGMVSPELLHADEIDSTFFLMINDVRRIMISEIKEGIDITRH
jgi:hypothetical protein